MKRQKFIEKTDKIKNKTSHSVYKVGGVLERRVGWKRDR